MELGGRFAPTVLGPVDAGGYQRDGAGVHQLSESEVEQIELSGEGQSGVIRLEDLVSGRQQQRFQEHSVQLWLSSLTSLS